MLISLLIAILVIGLIIYLIRLLPLEEPWKTAAIAIVVVIAIIWLLGFIPGGPGRLF